MKFSITLASFRSVESLDRTLSRLAEMGFDAFEMFGEPELVDAKSIEALKSCGIPVCGITGMWGRVSRDSSTRRLLSSDRGLAKDAENYVLDCMRFCNLLGGSEFNVCLFADELGIDQTHRAYSEKEKQSMAAKSAETLSGLSKHAREYGVTLLLEPLNRYSTPYCCTAKDAVSIVSAAKNSDSLGVMLDTFHMNIEEDNFRDAINVSAGLLKHTHFADNNRRIPGFAHIDFEEIVSSLRKIGYGGFVSFEPNIPDGSYEDDIRKGLNFVRAISIR